MKILAVSTLILLSMACGKSGPSRAKAPPVENIVATNFSNEPVMLEKKKRECLQYDQRIGTNFFLHLFLDGMDITKSLNFVGLIQNNLLKDSVVISRTVYGENVELILSGSEIRSEVKASPQDVNICPEDDEYPQDSIESAALNTAYYIKKTHENFKIVEPDILIKPITLTISPSIIRSYVTKNESGELVKNSTYMTNNAVYFPGNDTIAFLPMDRRTQKLGLSMKFWEIPMVASHEYGHHLFKSIFGRETSTGIVHHCFGQNFIDGKYNFPYELRKITFEDVLLAFNEGFSDLISYYTLDELERGVKGVKCLEMTRDVGSKMLIDGKQKIFDQKVISSFFSSFPDLHAGNCQLPSFQEIHVLGAIFAHSADTFLSGPTTSKEQKLMALVHSMKALKSQKKVLEQMAPSKSLEKAMMIFFRSSNSALNRPFDSVACAKIQEIYPGLELEECHSL